MVTVVPVFRQLVCTCTTSIQMKSWAGAYWEFNGDWVSGFVSYIDGMDGVSFNEDPKRGLQSWCTE